MCYFRKMWFNLLENKMKIDFEIFIQKTQKYPKTKI